MITKFAFNYTKISAKNNIHFQHS